MAEVTHQPPALQWQHLLQLPAGQRLGLMLTLATLIAVLVAAYLWSQAPDYRVLYANLSDGDGGAAVSVLQQMNIPYKFADGGALLVPANQVHELRLRLAAQGLPKGGLVGFEVMENQKFGTSQFAEQINYQRALEGELARSIQSLSVVQSARVHLALAKPSAFLREQAKPSASVLVNLYSGRSLDPAQVSAIVHLVSSSVPDLQAQAVTLVDQSGALLSSDTRSAAGTLDANQLKFRQALEQRYSSRIEDILGAITGAGNVRAQVTAELDFSENEGAEEIYKPNQDPANAVIRSHQISESNTGNSGANGGGVPGALSNQPPAAAAAPVNAPNAVTTSSAAAASPNSNSRKDATINYEVNKTVRHTREASGRVQRLAVAVVVNQKKQTDNTGRVKYTALAAAELAQMTGLVKEVIAYDKDRGDTVSVVNSAFSDPSQEKFTEPPFWKQPQTIDLTVTIMKNLLIGTVLLLVVFKVLRPLLKSYSAMAAAAPQLARAEAEESPPLLNYEHHVEHAKQIARSDPKIVANVVKNWVASDGK